MLRLTDCHRPGMDLASLLNRPSDFVFGDPPKEKTYKLTEPTLLQCAEYQRDLERDARAGAARATELPEEDRRFLLRDVQRDITAGVYCWGGAVCIESLRTPQGLAKLLAIVLREQEVTPRMAAQMVERRMREIAAVLIAANESDDPEQKKNLEAVCRNLGLPPNFLSNSSSDSPIPPSAPPETMTPSAG